MIRVSIIQPLPMPQVSNTLYPFNTSLDEEISRLFGYFSIEQRSKPPPSFEDVMEEFRHNGRDSEYCPDFDPEAERETTRRRKKSKKPLPTECVFCRNNGEAEAYYTKHSLKDENGIVRCPVLRDYVCPICGASGDHAHTIKYCPKKPQSQTVAIANTFKYLRNSTGKRKMKSPNRVSSHGEMMKPLPSRNFELHSVSAAGR